MSEWGTDLPFAPVPLWVTELPISDRAVRLYTLLAGMRDYGTGKASYGRKLLAKKLHCSDDSLDRAKAELETHGAITVERSVAKSGEIARNVYTIHRIPPGSRTGAGTPIPAPERVVGSRTAAATNEKKENETLLLLDEEGAQRAWNGPATIGGTKVKKEEAALASEILAAFNEASGKKFAGREWLASIVRRIREHPDVSLKRHKEIVSEQFEHPWWKDDPTPSVIYGNGKTFDRALNSAKGRKRERRYTRD